MDTPEDILRRYWGYDSFRPCQREIVTDILAGHDVTGLLPTGGGKSITFQVPAMMLPGVTLVVTPLVSLMKDQADNLAARGIRAACLHSGLTRREARYAADSARLGRARIVYVAPEKLRRKPFLQELRSWDVSLIVVDEAHCISQWGYDFRPSYLHIAELRPLFPDAPMLALTASATPDVVADIADKLGMRSPRLHALSFARPNLSFIVRRTPHKEQMLLHVLSHTSGCAIVYVRSRQRSVELAATLRREGIDAAPYHAGLDPMTKTANQDAWRTGAVRVMVATNAFGMGIDKPDVRLVVHFDLPSTLEEYYQEAGRAGRDGAPAYAVLLYAPSDNGVLRRRISEQFPPKEFVARIYEELCVSLDISVGGGFEGVYDLDLRDFCNRRRLPVRQTHNALALLSRAGYIEYSDEQAMQARVIATMRRDEFYDLRLEPVQEAVLMVLLRNCPGIFADYVGIDEGRLAAAAGVSQTTFYDTMLALSRMHVLHYVPRRLTPYVYFPYARIETRHVQLSPEVYDLRRERAGHRTEQMLRFASATHGCRTGIMLEYFGQQPGKPCGKCDLCRERAAATTCDDTDLRRAIAGRAAAPGGLAISDLTELYPSRPDRAADALRSMLDDGTLRLEGNIVRPATQ